VVGGSTSFGASETIANTGKIKKLFLRVIGVSWKLAFATQINACK
jgi:hypothetical protein